MINFFYDRDQSHQCLTKFSTTLDMRRKDVVYGSKVGNTTNPQFLEVDSWVIWSLYSCILFHVLNSSPHHSLHVYIYAF